MKPWILLPAAVGCGCAYWLLPEAAPVLPDGEQARAWVVQLGGWGALALILLMIVSIIAGPLPTIPFAAVIAGNLYGPWWGTAYVLLGAEAGAVCAFLLARVIGEQAQQRLPAIQSAVARLNRHCSQNWLTVAVFASRLLPFVGFASVSYAAGLTPLSLWRFALATATGLIPLTFILVNAAAYL